MNDAYEVYYLVMSLVSIATWAVLLLSWLAMMWITVSQPFSGR